MTDAYKEELKKLKKMGSINYDIDDEDEIELRKRGQSEKVDVQSLTNNLLKMCNIVRDKNYGSNILFK